MYSMCVAGFMLVLCMNIYFCEWCVLVCIFLCIWVRAVYLRVLGWGVVYLCVC